MYFESCLGDFIAIATGKIGIKYKRNGHEYLAGHSGLTSMECNIPLILKRVK